MLASVRPSGIDVSEDVGETDFRFQSKKGERYVGYGAILTILSEVPASQASAWAVDKLMIYTAPESQAILAGGVFLHMLSTLEWDQVIGANDRETCLGKRGDP